MYLIGSEYSENEILLATPCYKSYETSEFIPIRTDADLQQVFQEYSAPIVIFLADNIHSFRLHENESVDKSEFTELNSACSICASGPDEVYRNS